MAAVYGQLRVHRDMTAWCEFVAAVDGECFHWAGWSLPFKQQSLLYSEAVRDSRSSGQAVSPDDVICSECRLRLLQQPLTGLRAVGRCQLIACLHCLLCQTAAWLPCAEQCGCTCGLLLQSPCKQLVKSPGTAWLHCYI